MTLVKTYVWVQGSILAKAFGKTTTSTQQQNGQTTTTKKSNNNNNKSAPKYSSSSSSLSSSSRIKPSTAKTGTSTAIDLDRTGGNWSWTKCILESGDISASDSAGNDDALGVYVSDQESEFHEQSVTIPSDLWKNVDETYSASTSALVVMANEWESPPDDLITLTHLHEPAAVYCLKRRYQQDLIYTATGPILIALNPFKALPELYDESVMHDYWLAGEGLSVDSTSTTNSDPLHAKPHIFQNAHVAFRSMMKGMEQQLTQQQQRGEGEVGEILPDGYHHVVVNQSMLVSGESGAGKTVTTKHIMKYLATLSQRKAIHSKPRRRESSPGRSNSRLERKMSHARKHSSRTASWKVGAEVEERILESNPILEAFGNARTVRNDNSSRFGKFIELQFKQTGSLIGARINTYLLEKVRLVHQADGERTFHIFYEVLAASTPDERDMFLLKDYTAKDFKMTNQSETYDRRDGVEDDKEYDDLIFSLGTMGIDDRLQQDIIGVVCAFLHASNLTFLAPTEDSSQVDDSSPHLYPVLELLGLEKDAFNAAMTEYELDVGGKFYKRHFSVDGAENTLQAFLKGTYAAMFSFLVQIINKKIDSSKPTTNTIAEGQQHSLSANIKAATISVLDIFGFESFECNSFEQLCINYCNEALQQQFNRFIFKTEQDEYKKEGIVWDFIKFPDNMDVIDLIDKSRVGILPILTDQCRTPHGTDKSFIDGIYKTCGKSERFLGTPLHQGKMQFIISHYAGPVMYDGKDFVEKNKEETPRGAWTLLESSSKNFVQLLGRLARGDMDAAPSVGGRSKKRPTVGSQFSSQLTDLRNRINKTNPHYVRCLKPNQSLKPDEFDSAMIADQLRYAGVLEAIRVSRVGYSQRYTKSHFLDRYRFIAPDAVRKGGDDHAKINALDMEIAKKIWMFQHPEETAPTNMENISGIQEGTSKVFLRQDAFEFAEKILNETLMGATVKIQSVVRRFLGRCRHQRTKQNIITCQACARRYLARMHLRLFREQRAAFKIQSYLRMSGPRRQLASKKYASLWLQRLYRGRMARRNYEKLYKAKKAESTLTDQLNRSAVVIQCMYRMKAARGIYEKRFSGKYGPTSLLEMREATKAVIPPTDETKQVYSLEAQPTSLLEMKEAAKAVIPPTDETKQVYSLEARLARAKHEAKNARLALVGLSSLDQHLEAAMADVGTTSTIEVTRRERIRVLERENDQLKEKLGSGAERYHNAMYSEHLDLLALDERLDIAATQSKKSKAELKLLMEALSILT